MSNKWDEMREAFKEAQAVLRSADAVRDDMVKMLCGRLNGASPYYLKELKRELRKFNINTGRWMR